MRSVLGLLILFCAGPSVAAAPECVILLHGLMRSSGSMEQMAEFLDEQGYRTANIDYPSRTLPIEELAGPAIDEGIQQCGGAPRIHVVTHSMGGILLRYYFSQQPVPRFGRAVLLAPPNQGSEIVDNLKDVPGFAFLNGPAGRQLGTDPESMPQQLGPLNFEAGVIAGDRAFDIIMSLYLPNPDDGKVTVASTKIEGMADHIVVQRTHAFLMNADDVQAYTLQFLKYGKFDRP